MPRRLVIVESPTKARTLKKFLGSDYIIESSVGHVRDLPASAAEIPDEVKKEPWARLGVNVDEGFEPLYIVSPDKKKVIRELKAQLKNADELLLATDEDREGEAISWHLVQILDPKVPMRRMVFHEITREAIFKALEKTRPLDEALIEAYKARRIIDRLYGYELSPILWRKIAPRLSAGRVQSVAIRILVERELERMRFQPARYWDVAAEFETEAKKTFSARLVTYDGRRLAGGKDFDPETGKLTRDDVALLDEPTTRELIAALEAGRFEVASVEEKPFTQRPAPPFTTSTLQQEGGRKLRFSSSRTMRAAQRLYELGYITYMRTDSVALSGEALRATRNAVQSRYGAEFLPAEPRTYKNKVKNAQEAHEAIRPAGESFPLPDEIKGKVSPDELKVYELIWKRTMACQMLDARGRRMIVRISGAAGDREAVFQANGSTIDFHGFLRAYVEGSDDPDAALADREVILPPVRKGDTVTANSLDAEDHVTQPPARLTEASLVKMLEESGVGRPSTYASIIETIQRREYTFKKGNALVPTFTAFAVVKLMKEHFENLIDLNFTAAMEDRLDSIARAEHDALPYLKEFYFGNGVQGLQSLIARKSEDIDARSICTIALPHASDDGSVVARVGRYGPYLQRGDDTAPVPDGTCPDELTRQYVTEIFETSSQGPRVVGNHPEFGLPIYAKTGRFGPYLQLGDPAENSKEKPKMVSLLPGMTPDTVDLETAVELLELPRVVGQDPDGVDIVAHYGRYGAYIKRGDDTRSLEEDDDILKITVTRALELLAQEKRRGRQAAKPLKTWETVEALEGNGIKLLKGRYGPYVTDGETNASLPRDFGDPLTLEVDQAVQLILDRRAKGPAKKRKKKTTAKKTTKKKTTKKKKTKKKATRKKTARKTAKKTSA